jgi:hypothetical protein
MLRTSLQANLYMTYEDQIFVANVVVINPTRETMVMNVISQLIGTIAKLNTITKICKYRGIHEGHHFISMAMEVHGALGHDMNHFKKDFARLFHNRQSKGHLSLSFFIQFFKQCVSITLQHTLTFTIERKIALVGDACYKPPIIIRSHDLHANDIIKVVGEIASYHEKD